MEMDKMEMDKLEMDKLEMDNIPLKSFHHFKNDKNQYFFLISHLIRTTLDFGYRKIKLTYPIFIPDRKEFIVKLCPNFLETSYIIFFQILTCKVIFLKSQQVSK